MRCRDAHILMTRRQREILPREVSSHLDQHLADCAPCRMAQEDLQAARDLLRRAEPLLGAATAPSVRIDLDALLQRPAGPRARPAWGGGALAATAALALCLALALRAGRRHPSPAVPHPRTAGVSHPSIELDRRPPGMREASNHGSTAERKREQPGPTRPLHHSITPSLHHSTPPRRAPAPAVPDERYLDGRDPHLIAEWLTGRERDARMLAWWRRKLPRIKDDFVHVPFPLLASADPKSPALREAIEAYNQEAKVVDARLFQKVTLRLKAVSLEEFCAELAKAVGVRFRASRGVQDEKVTVLVKDRPAREVMREVARLFGFLWARTGEEKHYEYELIQDLKSRLAEQEMRDQDLRAALVALDQQMAAYGPFLGLTPEQIKARAAQSHGDEQARLGRVAGALWGGMQLYQRLTPGERAGLLNGDPLRFRTGSADPNRRLPGEWQQTLAPFFESGRFAPPGQPSPAITVTGMEVSLRINRSELGQLSLEAEANATIRGEGVPPGIGHAGVLATASSPSVAKPDNAERNAVLKKDPQFQRPVSLRPASSCPQVAAAEEARKRGESLPTLHERMIRFMESARALTPERYARMEKFSVPHVAGADVWEAVHDQTGMPIVADCYSHAYPTPAVTLQAPLFDALCRVGDELRVRWKKDDDFLLCRSTSYFWDKLKEVPNRALRRWSADRQGPGGLPLEDLFEMAQLSDEQLDSQVAGGVVSHCWNLLEWELLQKPGGWFSARPWLRLLATLPTAQVGQALAPGSLPVRDLAPEVQRAITGLMEHFPVFDLAPASVAEWRIRLTYASSGGYLWAPPIAHGRNPMDVDRLPLVTARTAQETLAQARRIDASAGPEQILPCEGVFFVTIILPNGVAQRVAGERPMKVEVHFSGGG